MFWLRSAFCLSLLGGAAFAQTPAATKPPALATLETMVNNLGYTTTEDANKQSFFVVWPSAGNYNYKMHFSLSGDATIAFVYVSLDNYTPAQMKKLDYVKLLEADDTSDFYFSMEKYSAGETLYGNTIIPLDGLTPASLRSTLSGWSDSMDATDMLWDDTLWK